MIKVAGMFFCFFFKPNKKIKPSQTTNIFSFATDPFFKLSRWIDVFTVGADGNQSSEGNESNNKDHISTHPAANMKQPILILMFTDNNDISATGPPFLSPAKDLFQKHSSVLNSSW